MTQPAPLEFVEDVTSDLSFVARGETLPDVELLLLRFLNELVYLRDAAGLLLRARRAGGVDAAGLAGELTG